MYIAAGEVAMLAKRALARTNPFAFIVFSLKDELRLTTLRKQGPTPQHPISCRTELATGGFVKHFRSLHGRGAGFSPFRRSARNKDMPNVIKAIEETKRSHKHSVSGKFIEEVENGLSVIRGGSADLLCAEATLTIKDRGTHLLLEVTACCDERSSLHIWGTSRTRVRTI